MGRLVLAFRIFFGTLFGTTPMDQVAGLLEGPEDKKEDKPRKEKPSSKPKAVRSDAITLLAALQREARLVDLIQEPLEEYSDEQIGAAARDVLRDSKQVLDRLLQLRPFIDAEDEAEIETPANFDAACFRLSGNVSGEAPFKGALQHHGWVASKCELPSWTGSNAASMVVAPAEIEVNG